MSNDVETAQETPSSAAPASKPRNRRRRLIVDKPFQYRLIGLLLAIWAANSLFFSIVLYYFYQGHIQRFYELVPRPGVAPLLSAPVLFTVAIGFIVLFGMVMVTIVGVYLSNQIAGPLYRVKLSLNRVSEGDVNFEIRFRDRDFLEDFPGYFNNMLRSLKERSAKDVESLAAIERSLDDPERARALVVRLREDKERQLGLTPEDRPESAGVAVH